MIRLASATISSLRLFSKLKGLSANARVEPGSKIAPLQPFPQTLPQFEIPYIRGLSLCSVCMIATAREVMPECSRAECYWKCRTASIIFRAL